MKLTGDPSGHSKASANSGIFLRVPSTLHRAGECGSDLNLASCSVEPDEIDSQNPLAGTHSGFGPHVRSPNTTKGNEEQLFASVGQAGEEKVVRLLVELGLPSPVRLNESTIPDILRRGPISQKISRMISSKAE